LAAATTLVITAAQPGAAQPGLGGGSPSAGSPSADRSEEDTVEESPTGLWVVQLEDAPLATYTGGVPGLAATSPRVTGDARLDADAPASLAYLDHLADRQAEFATTMDSALGRSVAVEFQYLNVLNAMAVRVDAAEAARLARLPGVTGIYRDELRELDSDVSHDLIGSTSIWAGDTGPGLATQGEGVVVGMIDTGVNPLHPSFAAVDGDGFVHQNPLGPGNFVGVCDPADPQHEDICNDKLIGAWNFHPTSPDAQDANGHGTHTGSTMAGNRHEASFTAGGSVHTRTIQGVAPRANLISYLVCFPSCPQTSSVAAVNQAIADPTTVLNYSISGSDNPWADVVDLAFLDAFEAGIYISASAGNAGPGASTVAKTGPWNAAVAASTNHRVIAHELDTVGPGPVPPELVGVPAVPSNADAKAGPVVTTELAAQIRFVESNPLGCDPFPAGAFDGAIALIQRGAPPGVSCPFSLKVDNAAAAGAVAVVFFNNVGGPPVFVGGLTATTIPAVSVTQAEGEQLRDFIAASAPEPVEVVINAGTELVLDDEWQDVVAGFSSRGPSQFELLAPTFAAPGVNVLAAANEAGGDPEVYYFNSGTSMASPHGAGAGALMQALHPDWSPAQVRSALAATADPDPVRKEDGVTPADPFDRGSGRLDLAAAGRVGLVMDETTANFVAANPAIGGEPKTLNLPAMLDYECGVCAWERTVTSVADATATYTAVVDAPAGVSVTVNPSEFTVAAGATVDLTVEVDTSGLAPGERAFADVRLVTGDSHAGGEPIAPVHYPVVVVAAAQAGPPQITVDPDQLVAEQAAGEVTEQALTIGNTGESELAWQIGEGAGVLSVLHDNGPFVTHPGAGPGGADHSVLQTASLGMTTFGGNVSAAASARITDDFIVDPGGWQVDTITFYGYQTGSSTGSSFTAVNYRIWDGPPDDPDSSVVFGDTSTNRLVETGWTDAFRISETTVNTDRPVMRIVADAGLTLGEGSYWVDWQLDGTIASGPWQPPITITGQAVTGDARQFFDGAWQPWLDGGTSTQQGAPFTIEGELADGQGCDAPTDVPWLAVAPDSGTTAPGGASEVTVAFDATGLAAGGHEAVLCVESNDPAMPLVEVPVSLTVTGAVCDETITGVHAGALAVTEGVTCLAAGAQVLGEVNVSQGAGLVATAAVVQGPVSAIGAARVELVFSQVTGPVLVSGATGNVSLFGSQVTGSVTLLGSGGPTVSGNTIIGSLSCFGNEPPPADHGLPNTATGGKLGQCAGL
jgi:hypothetical protein